jgi:hypothetical protein
VLKQKIAIAIALALKHFAHLFYRLLGDAGLFEQGADLLDLIEALIARLIIVVFLAARRLTDQLSRACARRLLTRTRGLGPAQQGFAHLQGDQGALIFAKMFHDGAFDLWAHLIERFPHGAAEMIFNFDLFGADRRDVLGQAPLPDAGRHHIESSLWKLARRAAGFTFLAEPLHGGA